MLSAFLSSSTANALQSEAASTTFTIFLCFADDCVEVRLVFKAFRVDFVDSLVPDGRVANQSRVRDGRGRQLLQLRFLLGRRWRVEARLEWRAELRPQRSVVLARVFAGASGDLSRQQIHDRAVLIGRPHAAVMAQETRSGALLAAKASRAVEEPRHEPFEADRHLGKLASELVDCSSSYAMAKLVGLKDQYRVAFANDPDSNRHDIVTAHDAIDYAAADQSLADRGVDGPVRAMRQQIRTRHGQIMVGVHQPRQRCAYVKDLRNVVDMDAIRAAGLKLAARRRPRAF